MNINPWVKKMFWTTSVNFTYCFTYLTIGTQTIQLWIPPKIYLNRRNNLRCKFLHRFMLERIWTQLICALTIPFAINANHLLFKWAFIRIEWIFLSICKFMACVVYFIFIRMNINSTKNWINLNNYFWTSSENVSVLL